MVKICSRCVYDEKIPGISFDFEGVCNYCKEHENLEKEYPVSQQKFDDLIKRIKTAGRHRRYDCVMGVSGGCDSSYLLSRLVDSGVRPLAVNFDNHWNTPIAVENLEKMTSALDVDFVRITVNRKEYDDICRSFFLAGVPDIDIPADIALATTLLQVADIFKIKYMVDGHSFRTEGSAPIGLIYMDAKYIQSVQNEFGRYPLTTFPNLWMRKWLKWMVVSRIKRVRPMYYLDYNKEEVKKFLKDRFGWEWYGGHHLENKLTNFYHTYYLPKKFNLDHRYVEYSAFVRSGKMDRDEALKLVHEPQFFDKDIIEEVKTRLGFSDEEFDEIMKQPQKTYRDYKTYKQTFERFRWFFWLMYKFDIVPKSFFMKYTR